MPRSAREVTTALLQKGFRKRHNDHAFFHLWVAGQKTPILTKVSHGEKEIGDGLLGRMARQLRLTGKQFRELIDCSLTGEQLIRLLQDNGHIG